MEDILRLTIIWPRYGSLWLHGFAPLTGALLHVRVNDWLAPWVDALLICVHIICVVVPFANIACLIYHKRRKSSIMKFKLNKQNFEVPPENNTTTSLSNQIYTNCKTPEGILLLYWNNKLGIVAPELQHLSLIASVAFSELWVLLVSVIDPSLHFDNYLM